MSSEMESFKSAATFALNRFWKKPVVATRTLPIPDAPSDIPEAIDSSSDDEKLTGDESIGESPLVKRAREILAHLDPICSNMNEDSDADDVIVPATPLTLSPLSPIVEDSQPFYDEPSPIRRSPAALDLSERDEFICELSGIAPVTAFDTQVAHRLSYDGADLPNRKLGLPKLAALYELIVTGLLLPRLIRSDLHRHQVMQFSLRWVKKYHAFFCLFWLDSPDAKRTIVLNRETTTLFTDMAAKAKSRIGQGRALTRTQRTHFINKQTRERVRLTSNVNFANYYEDDLYE